ncbi:MAG: hypothetical protein ACI9VM_000670 [Candidatus Azotimanducaceae bacterium]|jgi:hypothetical protein
MGTNPPVIIGITIAGECASLKSFVVKKFPGSKLVILSDSNTCDNFLDRAQSCAGERIISTVILGPNHSHHSGWLSTTLRIPIYLEKDIGNSWMVSKFSLYGSQGGETYLIAR